MTVSSSLMVSCSEGDQSKAETQIDHAVAWLEDVAAVFTRFSPSSELMQMNARAGERVAISPAMGTVLELALDAAKASGGLFDPTLLPALEATGYDRDFQAIAFREAHDEWRVTERERWQGAWQDVTLDAGGEYVRIPRDGQVDLGGIVKGWAAGEVIQRYLADFPGALVTIGGDCALHGHLDGALWPLGVGTHGAGRLGETEPAAVVTLTNCGLATSGATERWWLHGGERAHHIIDPRTARPARVWIDAADDVSGTYPLIATATALAPTGAEAEVAAKVALLRGYPAALEAVEQSWNPDTMQLFSDARVALILVLGTGEVIQSTNLQAWLDHVGGGGSLWIT